MTRQNVTEGPREILTRKCPTCGGDGVVISEQSAAIDLERSLRGLARGSRVQAYRVEVNAKVASLLIGSGASRLQEIEAASRRRFFLVAKDEVHLDHFLVLEQGKLETVAPEAPFAEGATLELQPVEVGLYDQQAAVAKLDGYDVVVANAARLVGKKVKAKVQRILPDVAYATVVSAAKGGSAPITAEGEAEKPMRKPAAKKEDAETEADAGTETVEMAEGGAESEPKKTTRRGSRGGRRRKKPPTIHVPGAEPSGNGDEPAPTEVPVPLDAVAAETDEPKDSVGSAAEDGTPKKRKTRRGSRGGRNRRKKPAAAAPAETGESG